MRQPKKPLQTVFNTPQPEKPPSKTALLIIDVQKGYCEPYSNYSRRAHKEQDAVAQKIASLAPAFRKAAIPIYAVYYADSCYPNRAPDFHRFKPANDDIIIPKNDDSAFTGSNIEELLRKNGHDTLLICGVYLSLCVRKTAEDALAHGFKVCVMEDLTADWEDGERDTYHDHPPPPAGQTVAALRRNGISVEQSSAVLQRLAKDENLSPPKTKR